MNLERERATAALNVITNLQPTGKYLSYVKGLPAAIINNGLGQAMATLLSAAKGKAASQDDHRLLYDHIEQWLCREHPAAPYPPISREVANSRWLMEKITAGDQKQYVHAQAEAMAYLVWLKKFAKAFLKEDSGTAPEREQS